MANKFTWRIWLWIIVLLLSVLSIVSFPLAFLQEGILITGVESDSHAFDQGLKQGQIITKIDGNEIESVEDYSKIIQNKFPENLNQSVKTTIELKNSQIILFSNKSPEITVSEIPKTKIETGLDISGGARALVEPEEKELSPSEAEDLAGIIKNRLNVYGLEDIKITPVSDFSGKNYIKIEIAGATPKDIEELISEQGKFEAKIGNETVFVGGEKDITSVARSGQDAIIESCQPSGNTYFCNFRFTIFLSEDAAERHSEITKNLTTNISTPGYLSKTLDLYIDGKLVDTLLISEGLKGRVTTQISISGSGTGATQTEALDNAKSEMTKLQTILITGSLPYKMKISKLDTISPSLGKDFVNYIILAGVASLTAVSILILSVYRKFKISLALLATSISEIIIILGIASLIRWNLDLASIAGILTTIGTGIDQQIVILDESKNKTRGIRERLKMAFAIILGAYLTVLVAMIPLYWAAAGFFKGFAITTIIGITAGILITRPAFSDMIRKMEE